MSEESTFSFASSEDIPDLEIPDEPINTLNPVEQLIAETEAEIKYNKKIIQELEETHDYTIKLQLSYLRCINLKLQMTILKAKGLFPC